MQPALALLQAGRTQRAASIVSIIALLVAAACLYPSATTPIFPLHMLYAATIGVTAFAYLLASFMLMVHYLTIRALSLAILACAFAYAGLLMVAYVVTAPFLYANSGGVAADPRIAPWFFLAGHLGFAAIVLIYAFVAGDPRREHHGSVRILAPALGLIVSLTFAAILVAGRALPALVVSHHLTSEGKLWEALVLAIAFAAFLAVAMLRQKSALQMWLLVAVAAQVLDLLLGASAGARFTVGWLGGRVLELCSAMVLPVVFLREFAQLSRRLSELVYHDPLTGLQNRRFFDELLVREWDRAVRHTRYLALLMIDIDHFKGYNDRYGHIEGDRCLVRIAHAIRSAVRSSDVVARIGGEEFAVLLPETGLLEAEEFGERICAAVRELGIEHENTTDRIVTVSIGVASIRATLFEANARVVALADAALFESKRSGRNRISSAGGR